MSWIGTVYDFKKGEVTELIRVDGLPTSKHGEHRFPFHLDGENYFGCSRFEVIVYDNTDDGIDDQTACRIAYEAANKPIYWSDDRLCHWMYDFKVDGHWCEGLFHNNGLDERLKQFEQLHINVYD